MVATVVVVVIEGARVVKLQQGHTTVLVVIVKGLVKVVITVVVKAL